MSFSQTACESCHKNLCTGVYCLVLDFHYTLVSMYRFKGNVIMRILMFSLHVVLIPGEVMKYFLMKLSSSYNC